MAPYDLNPRLLAVAASVGELRGAHLDRAAARALRGRRRVQRLHRSERCAHQVPPIRRGAGRAAAAALVDRVESTRQVDRIRALEDAGVLTRANGERAAPVRKAGNDATHSHLFNVRVTVDALARCFELGMLFIEASPATARANLRTAPATRADLGNHCRRPTSARGARQQFQASKAELAEALTVLDAATSSRDAEAAARRQAEAELERARRAGADRGDAGRAAAPPRGADRRTGQRAGRAGHPGGTGGVHREGAAAPAAVGGRGAPSHRRPATHRGLGCAELRRGQPPCRPSGPRRPGVPPHH